MSDVIVATANTNPTPGSVVEVSVDEMVCSLSIENNKFSDSLPIIPSAARVRSNKVLYRLKLKARLSTHADGVKVSGNRLNIESNRQMDNVVSRGKTDSKGELIIVFETREPGDVELRVTTTGITCPVLKINLKEAWYEELFLITGYNVCEEDDFSGPLVEAKGLDKNHKEDFLFGARGVAMQGTGKDTEGHYIGLTQMSGGWHRNSRGAPDRVMSQTGTSFRYVDGVVGKYGLVTENHSIAVDPSIIPPHAKVDIEGVGPRFADDKGSAIRTYHIDNFIGAGESVVRTWMRGGVNGTKRRVKYLGGGV
ncbi:3D (Asp-Asp-Asp) domain-containing protein [Duganella sp. CF517]|uniref:3D domain-containing protein n=1 Tax=Duganella sp. CF517 TaxID=1881038 RepID=UPI0008D16F60|nr:3D domain-containing protein [Duganella sp. CF517]SEN09616.1 3D (Asp-Asp-Asp) domain-containing protein [Duganella sp. CF517]